MECQNNDVTIKWHCFFAKTSDDKLWAWTQWQNATIDENMEWMHGKAIV